MCLTLFLLLFNSLRRYVMRKLKLRKVLCPRSYNQSGFGAEGYYHVYERFIFKTANVNYPRRSLNGEQ